MPLYGVAQSGPNTTAPGLNLTSIQPGEPFTHFDGTETPVAGVKSVAFSRGPSPSGADNGTTWYVQFPLAAPVAVLQIQGANQDVEANYQTLESFTNVQQGSYTDQGRAAFYRAVLSGYTSGGMPVVRAQR